MLKIIDLSLSAIHIKMSVFAKNDHLKLLKIYYFDTDIGTYQIPFSGFYLIFPNFIRCHGLAYLNFADMCALRLVKLRH